MKIIKAIIKSKKLLIFYVSFLIYFSCNPSINQPIQGSTSFEFIPSSLSGIDFENRLEESLNTNVLMYEYFYNGGGVAAADFNSDGFIDLYFSSNMGDNKLYLNLSTDGFSFKDVTQTCGAKGREGPWKTGVSIVDINADGKPDIYLCYSGALPEEKRKNQLFINTTAVGSFDVTFEEMSTEYGLDSPAFTTMAYFFDFDRDGDLDVILLNHNPKNLPNLNELQTQQLFNVPDFQKGTRLMQNNNGKFVDITEQSGINGSELSYGLGLGVSDLNNDGWPDFYLSNDYNVPDYLYINNRNGTFTNKIHDALTHTSHFSMGNDIADINNDGLPDILTLDMLPEDNKRQKLLLSPDNWPKYDLNVRSGFHHQIMRNMLQLNNGDGTFSEIGQIAGISNTDWSWASLIADFDNDGHRDIFITNGYLRDFTNLDFINYMNNKISERGRFSREDVMELIQKMPASDVNNYMFKGTSNISFKNVTQDWGLKNPSNSNGAIYADLDNDGDLDLVVNNVNKPAYILKNNTKTEEINHLIVELKGAGQNTFGIGTRINLYSGEKILVAEQHLARGFQSSVSPILHFGLGTSTSVDSMVVRWPSGKMKSYYNIQANQRLYPDENDSEGILNDQFEVEAYFTQEPCPIDHQDIVNTSRDFDRQALLLKNYSRTGPCMKVADLNGDGIIDVIIGGSAGQLTKLYLGNAKGQYVLHHVPDFEKSKNSHDTSIEILDANGDGLLDIYIGSGGYHQFNLGDKDLMDRLYINQGNGTFKLTDLGWTSTTPTAVVKSFDINKDGFSDLIIGGGLLPGRWPEFASTHILVNDKKGKFIDETKKFSSEISNLGIVSDLAWSDLNGDGVMELIVVGDWMPITIFTLENGKLINATKEYINQPLSGLWNTIHVSDLNNDGLDDIVVGNMGTNHQLKASPDQLTEIFYDDFDQNGSIDPILCTYIMGVSYPYVTRDELLKQLVRLKKKFPDYASFANAQLSDILNPQEIKRSKRNFINQFETILLLSQPTKMLKLQTLPIEAQFAPVHEIVTMDVNKDGFQDMLLFGNDTELQLKLGRVAANYGQLFLGDGKGGFTYIPQYISGLNVGGDVRNVSVIKNQLWIGSVGKPLKMYELKRNIQ